MKKLSDKSVKALSVLIGIAGESARGERNGVNVYTEELSLRMGGPKVAFRDEAALRECAEWCRQNDLPLFTMMLSADSAGLFLDQPACKAAFRHGISPSRTAMKEAWLAEREEISSLDEESVAAAIDALDETVKSLNASKAPASRRALANARNQEIAPKSLDWWLERYRDEVLELKAPGQPLIHNSFLDAEEGYKARAWQRWQENLAVEAWTPDMAGTGEIVAKLQSTLDYDFANWITKRFGGFNLSERLAAKNSGVGEFEQLALDFYAGEMIAKDFFEKAVALLGQQYPAIAHLMFLKDMDAYVPVKPLGFEAGLRALGVDFYLSGFCSWDNYTKFLGYLERLRQMLLEREEGVTLLDAHSILWIIGSGYWFTGAGAEELAALREERGLDSPA